MLSRNLVVLVAAALMAAMAMTTAGVASAQHCNPGTALIGNISQ